MSCSAGYSTLLAPVDFHSDVRSDLALPDLFVTRARLSQVRLRLLSLGHRIVFLLPARKYFVSKERTKRKAFRAAGSGEAFIILKSFLYFGTKVPVCLWPGKTSSIYCAGQVVSCNSGGECQHLVP